MKSIPFILLAVVPALAQNAVIKPPPAPTSFDCAADGTVVSAVTGEPITRARVNVMANGTTGYSTVTDSSGKWAISNMGCAPGQLQVTRPGFLATALNSRNGPIRQLRLISGSPVHDLKTELTPQSVAFGKVLDDQGDPVTEAQVTVFTARILDGHAWFQQSGVGRTNDLGEYRIANLTKGKYVFCAHMDQQNFVQSTAQSLIADTCYPGPLEGGAAGAMDLPAGRESKVDFTMNEVPAVHVRGSVTGLPDGRGSGVSLIKRSSTVFGGYGNVPGTVRGGKFDFRVLPGSYMLNADYFENGKRLTARIPVDAGSSDIDNIVVHLDTGFTVTGMVHVVSQSGRAAPQQIGVNLRSSEPGNNTMQLKWDADHTSFAMNDMVPGSYRLDVFPPPAPFYVKSATLAGQDMLNNEVPIPEAAGPIEIMLRDDGGSVEGDVVDAAGLPVSAGIMLLRGTIRAANLASQANGHFKLQNLAPGDYTIYAWDDPSEVAYADADWMRRNGGGGMAITVAAGQNQQIKLTQQLVPPQ